MFNIAKNKKPPNYPDTVSEKLKDFLSICF